MVLPTAKSTKKSCKTSREVLKFLWTHEQSNPVVPTGTDFVTKKSNSVPLHGPTNHVGWSNSEDQTKPTNSRTRTYASHGVTRDSKRRSGMAIGQTRSVAQGLASVRAKVAQNPFQFGLAIVLVMCCGATKKVRFPGRAGVIAEVGSCGCRISRSRRVWA